MSEAHDLIHRFFAAMPAGTLDESLFTDDATVTTTTTPEPSPGAKYLDGIKLLQSLFPEGLHYTVDSVTAEDDRAAAEVRSQGTLADGEVFACRYAFIFRLRDGRIASIAEHFNPEPVERLIMPRMMAAMAKMQG